jgi:hypothetical protein
MTSDAGGLLTLPWTTSLRIFVQSNLFIWHLLPHDVGISQHNVILHEKAFEVVKRAIPGIQNVETKTIALFQKYTQDHAYCVHTSIL